MFVEIAEAMGWSFVKQTLKVTIGLSLMVRRS